MAQIYDEIIQGVETLEVTKQLIKVAAKGQGAVILESDPFRKYAQAIDEIDCVNGRRIASIVDTILGHGNPYIWVVPGAVLPVDDPDQIHEDEELLYPIREWHVGSDDEWEMPIFVEWMPEFFDWDFAKVLAFDYTKTRESIPYQMVHYVEEDEEFGDYKGYFGYSIEKIKTILNGTEINIVNKKQTVPVPEEITFGYSFVDHTDTVNDSIGSDEQFSEDIEADNEAKAIILLTSEFRDASDKVEALPYKDLIKIYEQQLKAKENEEDDDEYEDVEIALTSEYIVKNITKLLQSNSTSYTIRDLEVDKLIPAPIDEAVANPNDPIWGTIGWVVGEDNDDDISELLDKENNVTIIFGDTMAKTEEFETVIPFSFKEREFVSKPQEYYSDRFISAFNPTGNVTITNNVDDQDWIDEEITFSNSFENKLWVVGLDREDIYAPSVPVYN